MDESLRPDLLERMVEWSERSDFVLAMGTSLCGMNADHVVSRAAERAADGGSCLGFALINLQRTALDGSCALRIYARCDDVMAALAKRMRLRLRKETLDQPYWRD